MGKPAGRMMEKTPQVRLCPTCYEEMEAVRDSKNQIIYHKCPKCGAKILFSHAGH
ncbi:MAG: hypothetical protein NWF01_01565 [Candidatus Bathyarchaeota archaeon]|nr:hypothetical protein [Candidatus Bathyarchaeota archaeon]